MSCEEKLVHALTQTHLALLACAECICDANTDAEREMLQAMCELLATQAKALNDNLLTRNDDAQTICAVKNSEGVIKSDVK